MTLLREYGPLDRFPYLGGLGVDPDAAGRLDVVGRTVREEGFYVDAAGGEARLLAAGDPTPAGVWVAQTDIDLIAPRRSATEEPHGFGEGWGAQREQLGGDRSYPEEDSGGERVPEDQRDDTQPEG